MNIVIFDKLEKKNKIDINSPEARHIIDILKLDAGMTFRSGEWGVSKGEGLIEKIDSSFLHFTYTPQKSPSPPLPLVIIIAQIRPICMKRVLRFVGESGIKAIIFTPCDLSEKSYLQSNLYAPDSINKLIKEGVEISHDVIKPNVYFASSVSNAISIAEKIGVKNKCLLDIGDNTPKLEKKNDELSCIAIGPERGWSDGERGVFMKNGFLVYNIGNKVFRSEESAIVCVYPWL